MTGLIPNPTITQRCLPLGLHMPNGLILGSKAPDCSSGLRCQRGQCKLSKAMSTFKVLHAKTAGFDGLLPLLARDEVSEVSTHHDNVPQLFSSRARQQKGPDAVARLVLNGKRLL